MGVMLILLAKLEASVWASREGVNGVLCSEVRYNECYKERRKCLILRAVHPCVGPAGLEPATRPL
jgi:hypothetical protein